MSKVVLKINAKYYQDLAKEALDNNDLSTALRHYRAALSLDNLTKDERLTIKKEYAKTLALRGKFSYSNRIIYEVLVEAPHDAEAYAILMFNFKSVDYNEAAQYYAPKAQPYLDKKRDDFKKYLKDLNQDYLYYDDLEIPVSELKNEEFDRLISGEFPFLDELKKATEKKPTFTVIDHVGEFDDLMNKLYDAARQNDYAKAIDYANEAIKLNVSEDIKISARYAKCVALMMMNYTRESLDQTNEMLERYPDDHSFILLKAELMSAMKNIEGLIKTLKVFNDKPLDEIMPFERIIDLYLKNHLFEEALSFVEPRLPYFVDSYTLLSFYGVILFDLGRIKEAKSVFSDLNGIYGDLCDARHLLTYIKFGTDEPILTIPQYGDIKKITDKYVNDFTFLLEGEPIIAVSYIALDVDDFKAKMIWLLESNKIDIVDAMIQKVFLLSTAKMQPKDKKAIKELMDWIFNLPAMIDGLSQQVKVTIFEFEILSKKNFPYLDSRNLFRISKDVFKGYDFSVAIWQAVNHAVAFEMAMDSERYKRVLSAIRQLHDRYKIKKFKWKSRRNIYALIVYIAANRELAPEEVIPGIIYDKNVFKKYLEEYDMVQI